MTVEQLRTQSTESAKRPAQASQRVDLSPQPNESWPFYGPDEIEAVVEVLRSGKVNQWTGPEVFAFENACGERFGGNRGVAVANGSVALELALRAFNIGPGDEVIVSPRSFVASVYCAMLVGATPVFADIDPDSGNITAATVQKVMSKRTKAIIPVHLAGWPVDMPAIMGLIGDREIKVIEDCAQGHGAIINGRSVGSFGDAAAFSFCQDKIISTAGEGGFVSFKKEDRWKWAWSYKDHGKNFAKMRNRSAPVGQFQWVHDQLGTNWRMTGLQAAIGLLQLQKLEQWSAIRARNAEIWAKALREVPRIRIPLPDPNSIRHAFYKLHFYIDESDDSEASGSRAQILRRSAEAGLRVFSGSCSEIYLEKPFSNLRRPDCPVARSLGCRSLVVEVHPTLDPTLLELRAARLAEIGRELLGGC